MKSHITKYNSQSHLRVIDCFSQGQAVILPTETVYGIAIDASNKLAVQRLFDIKNRPDNKPVQIMVANLQQAQAIGEFNELAISLGQKYFPGAVTLVVRRKKDSGLCDKLFCGLETIGIRIPNHQIMQKILHDFGKPIAISSANISGNEPCVDISDIDKQIIIKIPLIIDDGRSEIATSSTVIDCTGSQPGILRQGAIKLS